MKRLAGVLLAGALALAAAETRTFTGFVTDTMCGADHKAMNIPPDSKCVRECIRLGKQYKYALHDGKNMYVLSDQQTPEKFAARKVKVTGVLYEKTKIIKVEKIEPAAESGHAH